MNIFGEKHVNNQQRCECRIPPMPQKHGKKCMASFLESGSIFHSYIHLQAALETNHLTTLGYASKIASRSSMKKRPRANGQWGRERNIQRPPEISCPARDWSENCFIHLSGISLSLSLLEALVWLFPPCSACRPSMTQFNCWPWVSEDRFGGGDLVKTRQEWTLLIQRFEIFWEFFKRHRFVSKPPKIGTVGSWLRLLEPFSELEPLRAHQIWTELRTWIKYLLVGPWRRVPDTASGLRGTVHNGAALLLEAARIWHRVSVESRYKQYTYVHWHIHTLYR